KEKIIEKAVEKGILHYEDSFHLNEQEVYNLIFHAGFSTKDEVSELSGRGVGMDVVKSNIQSLQGEIEIKSIPNQGTSIYLRLPLTLAVVRVLLFEVSGYILAFPMANVYEILTINRDQLESIGSRILFHFNGAYIPVIKLSSILDIPGNTYNNQDLELILLEEGGRTLGIIVDKLIGRQEIVIKNLGSILQKVPFIMGCTILSDRRIVLILNSKEVIDEGFQVTERVSQQMLVGQHHIKQNILIVDDSSIHRQQLKTILVREGYHVDEAENGFEALKLVRLKSYKILCVDIVMPLMDGFELTKRMRSLPLYRSIPIFLITSSNSREDRDRGYKIGANEFFEKPINPELILEKVKYYIEKEGAK
ncbi:MAG: response regulator, partial [Thermoplasmata archaeon]